MAHRSDIVFLAGSFDTLKTYEFGPKRMTHRFCQTCGINLFTDHAKNSANIPGIGKIQEYVGVNVRTFEDVDIDKLKLHHFDGKNEYS